MEVDEQENGEQGHEGQGDHHQQPDGAAGGAGLNGAPGGVVQAPPVMVQAPPGPGPAEQLAGQAVQGALHSKKNCLTITGV